MAIQSKPQPSSNWRMKRTKAGKKASGEITFDRFLRCSVAIESMSSVYAKLEKADDDFVRMDYNAFINT